MTDKSDRQLLVAIDERTKILVPMVEDHGKRIGALERTDSENEGMRKGSDVLFSRTVKIIGAVVSIIAVGGALVTWVIKVTPP